MSLSVFLLLSLRSSGTCLSASFRCDFFYRLVMGLRGILLFPRIKKLTRKYRLNKIFINMPFKCLLVGLGPVSRVRVKVRVKYLFKKLTTI